MHRLNGSVTSRRHAWSYAGLALCGVGAAFLGTMSNPAPASMVDDEPAKWTIDKHNDAVIERKAGDLTVTAVLSVEARGNTSWVVVSGSEHDSSGNQTSTFQADLWEYTGAVTLADDGNKIWFENVSGGATSASFNGDAAVKSFTSNEAQPVAGRLWDIHIPIPFTRCKFRIGGWGEEPGMPACLVTGYYCVDAQGNPASSCVLIICSDGLHDCLGTCCNVVQE